VIAIKEKWWMVWLLSTINSRAKVDIR